MYLFIPTDSLPVTRFSGREFSREDFRVDLARSRKLWSGIRLTAVIVGVDWYLKDRFGLKR